VFGLLEDVAGVCLFPPAVASVATTGSLIVRRRVSKTGFWAYAISILKLEPRPLHSPSTFLSAKMLLPRLPLPMTLASKQCCHHVRAVLDTILPMRRSALSERSARRSFRETFVPRDPSPRVMRGDASPGRGSPDVRFPNGSEPRLEREDEEESIEPEGRPATGTPTTHRLMLVNPRAPRTPWTLSMIGRRLICLSAVVNRNLSSRTALRVWTPILTMSRSKSISSR